MSDGESVAEGDTEGYPSQAATPITNVRIAPDIPVIFADNVASHAWTTNLSKFYLVRTDSDPLAKAPNTQTNVAQVVMPNDGFIMAFAFFEHRLKAMIESGSITQEALENARKFWLRPAA
jgi:hypothetical protein